MTVNQDGEEKLNFMQMAMMGMKNPKGLVQEVLRLPLKRLFWKGIRYRNIKRALLLFSILLAIQLKYSRQARSFFVRTTSVLAFGCTFFGLLVTLGIFAIKFRMHKNALK